MCTLLKILAIVVVFYNINTVIGDVIVETKSGKVAGIEVKSIIGNEKYISFLSIPYAEPPIGNLRFKVKIRLYTFKI